jgi:hypothetical protein
MNDHQKREAIRRRDHGGDPVPHIAAPTISARVRFEAHRSTDDATALAARHHSEATSLECTDDSGA